jgi:hemerythrin
MAYLDWNPAFDTGIPGIDYEHHRLVDMLNEINELVLSKAEPHKVADTLARFHTLATAHFALEEKIMRDQRYPGLAGRRDIHYQLLDQVREIMDGYETGAFRAGESLPDTLKRWLGQAMDIDVKLFAEISDASLRDSGLSRA